MIKRYITLTCDGCGWAYDYQETPYPTLLLRDSARKDGWLWLGNSEKDYCKECQKK